jgi:hypothetical protein
MEVNSFFQSIRICSLLIFIGLPPTFAQGVECCQGDAIQQSSDNCCKREIEEFFLSLFAKEFGYTLLGIKPISTDEVFGEYFQKTSEKCFDELKKAFVDSPNFVLKIFSEGPCHSVELINRKAVRELVRNNHVVQAFIKKEFKCEDDFYSKIEDPNQDIHKILKKDAKIIGYLLGYCKTNVEYYIRRIELGTYLQKYPWVCFHPLPGGKYSDYPFVFTNRRLRYERLRPSKGFRSLTEEYEWIKQVEWDIREESKPVPPFFVSLPFYICRHGNQSEFDRERLRKARCKVAELFYNKSSRKAVVKEAAKK